MGFMLHANHTAESGFDFTRILIIVAIASVLLAILGARFLLPRLRSLHLGYVIPAEMAVTAGDGEPI